jgi:hypothetical protein
VKDLENAIDEVVEVMSEFKERNPTMVSQVSTPYSDFSSSKKTAKKSRNN